MFDEPEWLYPDDEWRPDPEDDSEPTPGLLFDPRFGTLARSPDGSFQYRTARPVAGPPSPGVEARFGGGSRGPCTLFPDGRVEYTSAEDRDDLAGAGG